MLPSLHVSMLRRRFGKQLAVIIEPALPFVGHAATSAAAFTVGMGLSQVSHAIPCARKPAHRPIFNVALLSILNEGPRLTLVSRVAHSRSSVTSKHKSTGMLHKQRTPRLGMSESVGHAAASV